MRDKVAATHVFFDVVGPFGDNLGAILGDGQKASSPK